MRTFIDFFFMRLNRKYDNLAQKYDVLRFIIFFSIVFPIILSPVEYQIPVLSLLLFWRVMYFILSKRGY